MEIVPRLLHARYQRVGRRACERLREYPDREPRDVATASELARQSLHVMDLRYFARWRACCSSEGHAHTNATEEL